MMSLFKSVEGIILSKVPCREKDLIANLLLRSGHRIGVLFYGGRVGKQAALLEVGNMLKLQVRRSKSRADDGLYSANEWSVIWRYRHIRNNYRAYYTLCFYVEIISKLSTEENLFAFSSANNERDSSNVTSADAGIFRVFSNAVFYLEDATTKSATPDFVQALTLFLCKLLYEAGIAPSSPKSEASGENTYRILTRVKDLKYSDYRLLDYENTTGAFYELYNYLCHHCHWHKHSIKSFALIDQDILQ
ncbi:MAG: recombination protein O N-terminal domain-containing protein [Oligoflexia bacterium]|nr:recombination protein O N-terminal domain-containing protein [Oligoflexia bacterium]MBF0364496.1 recombination protein O N-terminal domain-containing protein [Oligoflexia bacterium]